MPRACNAAAAALTLVAATFLSLSLSPASYVAATYTAKELRGEGAIEVQAVQDILNYNLGPTKAQQKNASVQTSDFLPDLPAYGLPGPCGVSPNVVKTKITVKCPDFDEFKKVLGWKNITLKVTMTLPGKAANGRAAPWPVVFIFAGFSVSSFWFFSCTIRRAEGREAVREQPLRWRKSGTRSQNGEKKGGQAFTFFFSFNIGRGGRRSFFFIARRRSRRSTSLSTSSTSNKQTSPHSLSKHDLNLRGKKKISPPPFEKHNSSPPGATPATPTTSPPGATRPCSTTPTPTG